MDTVRFGIGGRGAWWLRLLGIGLGIGLLVFLEPAVGPGAKGSIARAQRDDVAYEDEMGKGREFMRLRKYEDALKSFKRANEMVDKKSPESFLWMAQAYQGLEAYKNVVDSCEKLIELAGSDTQVRAVACNLKGIALQSLADGKDQKRLREAETVFREGLALNTELPILHYNLGFTLMQQGRDPEGIAELQKYLEREPKGPKFDEARKLLANPDHVAL